MMWRLCGRREDLRSTIRENPLWTFPWGFSRDRFSWIYANLTCDPNALHQKLNLRLSQVITPQSELTIDETRRKAHPRNEEDKVFLTTNPKKARPVRIGSSHNSIRLWIALLRQQPFQTSETHRNRRTAVITRSPTPSRSPTSCGCRSQIRKLPACERARQERLHVYDQLSV